MKRIGGPLNIWNSKKRRRDKLHGCNIRHEGLLIGILEQVEGKICVLKRWWIMPAIEVTRK